MTCVKEGFYIVHEGDTQIRCSNWFPSRKAAHQAVAWTRQYDPSYPRCVYCIHVIPKWRLVR